MNNKLIDWSCDLLSSIRIDQPGSEADAVEALRFMAKEYLLTNVCMMPLFDARKEPVSVFLLKRAAYEDLLFNSLPKDLFLKFSAKVLLHRGLSTISDLEKLTEATDGYLPLALPIASYEDWIDIELNHLLYKRKLKLLLLSCENFPILYSDEIVEKLFRMPNTIFMFNYRVLTDAKLCRIVYNICQSNHQVLFGTDINSLHKAWNFPVTRFRNHATSLFSKTDLQKIDHFSRMFWNKSF